MALGDEASLQTCSGADQQHFFWASDTGELYLAAQHTLCLDSLTPTALGNRLQVQACAPTGAQSYELLFGTTIRVFEHYKACLGVPLLNATPGSAVQAWDCSGNGDQQWVFSPNAPQADFGLVRYAGNGGGLCLDAGDMGEGTTLLVKACDAQLPAQRVPESQQARRGDASLPRVGDQHGLRRPLLIGRRPCWPHAV